MHVNDDLPDASHRPRDSKGIGSNLSGWALLVLGVALAVLLQQPPSTP